MYFLCMYKGASLMFFWVLRSKRILTLFSAWKFEALLCWLQVWDHCLTSFWWLFLSIMFNISQIHKLFHSLSIPLYVLICVVALKVCYFPSFFIVGVMCVECGSFICYYWFCSYYISSWRCAIFFFWCWLFTCYYWLTIS